MIRFLLFFFVLAVLFFPIFFLVKKILIWATSKFTDENLEDEYSSISHKYNNLSKEMKNELTKMTRKQKRYEKLSNKINEKEF